LQKLLWRILATSHEPDFSQEDQKDRRRDLGVRAAAGGRVLRCAPKARRAIKPSDLLTFL
jgi:hypothetical protein